MKTTIKLAFATIIIATSCIQENMLSTTKFADNVELHDLSYEIIKGGYWDFSDNQYQMKISKEEAIDRGFSGEAYDYLLASMDEVNSKISQEIQAIKDFSIYEVKSGTSEVVDQVNKMIIDGIIKVNDDGLYSIGMQKSQVLELGYSEEAFDTAKYRIDDETIYDSDFILQPQQIAKMLVNAQRDGFFPEIGTGWLETIGPNLQSLGFYSLPSDYFGMNALRLTFYDKEYAGVHYFKTNTEGGSHELNNCYPGMFHYIPVVMYGVSVELTYSTTGLDGGLCYYVRTLR